MLIEQRDLDRRAAPREDVQQTRRREVGILRLRSQRKGRRLPSRMYVERRQRAGILQDDPRAIGELEHRARESRKRLRCSTDRPVAIHAEVHVNDAPVIQMHELMLAAALHIAHDSATEGAHDAR